ncbi:PTS fructose-like transporter subunit IIB [Zooshikella marina]|uniref:PTS fructose-like transporter subunit IIB n=1 Tax=Zooshikella ganghwensis TaxID=202772 RepID=UPI001BAF9D38|nr:PTS fructose-like transporter subunit IIB [Zooshikella ganghwensis]MBU2706046.1 PTS fructose-like transporter subunit IIB [Zooshikella ganghwensis]
MKIAVITYCPGGVINTFLAADAIQQAANKLGWEVLIESRSHLRPFEPLSVEQLQQVDCVIVAGAGETDLSHLEGLPVYRGAIEGVLAAPEAWLENAVKQASRHSDSAITNIERLVENTTSNDEKAPQNNTGSTSSAPLKVVGITACPTGVAHTFMAAEALTSTGKSLGYDVKIETRGSVGAKNTLTDEEIAAADLVILATDIDVDTQRFVGKRVFHTSTGQALKQSKQVFEKAQKDAAILGGSTAAGNKSTAQQTEDKSSAKGLYKHLMTGVSFMLPVVVAGGLIIALSFVFGIEAFKEEGTLAAALMQIGGGSAFALMIPVLAAYISFSIADRPGLAPGLVGGMLASSLNSGFLGGIAAGFIAGYIARWINEKVKLPDTLAALKPILIIPFLATLATGLIMIYVVGTPVASIMAFMTDFLANMEAGNAVLLGAILGAMMCFDLGGPVNKAAYTFGVGLLASKTYLPMAAIMAAGMVPAIGMGLATFIFRKRFSKNEHEAGKASFVLGLCFISEGAIPFAAKDPLRVIPSCIAGGVVTGALSMWIGATLMAPHGGIFVFFIPNAVNSVLMYSAVIGIGSLITAFTYGIWLMKKPIKE